MRLKLTLLTLALGAITSTSCRKEVEKTKVHSFARSDFSFRLGDYWLYKMSYGDTVKLAVAKVFEFIPGTTEMQLAEIGSKRVFNKDTIGTFFLSDTSFAFACENGIDEVYIVNHVIRYPFNEGSGWLNNRPMLTGDSMFFKGVTTETINGITYKDVYTFRQPPLASSIPAERVESEIKYVKGVGIVYQRNLNSFMRIDQRMELIGFHRK